MRPEDSSRTSCRSLDQLTRCLLTWYRVPQDRAVAAVTTASLSFSTSVDLVGGASCPPFTQDQLYQARGKGARNHHGPAFRPETRGGSVFAACRPACHPGDTVLRAGLLLSGSPAAQPVESNPRCR
ncbi:unnamed protein product [Lota lota]